MNQVIAFHGWRFIADPDATRAAYRSSASTGAAACSCAHCRNFVAQREREYPLELCRFLDSVGIDPFKEAEVWEAGPTESGLFFNDGWWHFVGTVAESGEEPIRLAANANGGARDWNLIFLPGEASLKLETLPREPLIQVEFTVELPWVLSEPYPT